MAVQLPQPAETDPDAALARFDALPVLQQAMLVRRIELQLAESGDPAHARISALCPEDAHLPDAPAAVHFDPEEWAPAVAPARHVIPDGDPRHHAVRAAIPAIAVLPDLARSVRYDWRTGTVVKGPALGWRERFCNLLHGYPPGADAAYAHVLAALDQDARQRKLADYFAHTYADRDGGVYEGISLYEAWYAGETIEMPDVDVIAFAVRVLGDDSFTSPIPADRRREGLYGKIHAAALEHRKHRTMLEAAAASFVCAEPAMDPMYARLVPRFHYLFATHGDDLARVRAVLRDLATRDDFIAAVDQAVVSDDAAMARREQRRAQLAAMASRLRALALAAH